MQEKSWTFLVHKWMYMKKHHWKYGQMEFWKLAHAICNLHLWYNFALLLQENYALVFSQSEACNFFMYIIKHCNNLVQVFKMTSWSHLNHLYIEEIKSNPQVYTTQEGIREIKNNPQVYTTWEGIREIKNNPQVYTTWEGKGEIKSNP